MGSATWTEDNVRSSGSRKRKRPSEGAGSGALLLQVDSPAKRVRRMRISRFHPRRVEVDKCNMFCGTVNGQPSSLLLDSGSSDTFTFMSHARRLRLVTGREPTCPMTLQLWCGPVEVEVIELDSVEIIVEGGDRVVTGLTVLPREVEHYYGKKRAHTIIVDINLLRRGAALHAFERDASSLLFRCRKRLCIKPKRKKHDNRLYKFWVHRAGHAGTRMSVLLDTGAKGFFASEATYARLLRETEGAEAPRGVCLDLGGGVCLTAGRLEQVAQQDWDFVMGADLLHKYESTLDYHEDSVTFTVGGRHFKLGLEHQ